MGIPYSLLNRRLAPMPLLSFNLYTTLYPYTDTIQKSHICQEVKSLRSTYLNTSNNKKQPLLSDSYDMILRYASKAISSSNQEEL